MVLGSFKAFQLVRRSRPDVTLAFFGAPSGIVAWFLKALFRIPYVVSLRGGDVPGFRKYDFWLYHLLITPFLHVVWKHAYRVVANSQGLRQLAENFNHKVKIDIIPNGVNLGKFTDTQRSWDPPRILAVGRLVYQKGFDLLLDALSSLSETPWELTIVGDGPRRPLLEKEAHDLGIGSRVHFAGWQDKSNLPRFYQEANLFVLPSRNEGMSNAVLEAMASNLPVIATSIAGNEELVSENKTGLLVPSESAEALRTALNKLMTNPAHLQEMGQAGRKSVEQNYSWINTAAQYQTLLEEAVEG
jgi:glycosyltransferase involved in cell wall biosynthesis